MKYLIPILFTFFVLTGCKKSNDVTPTGQDTKTITNNPLPSAPIDTDAFIHEIKFSAPFQLVVMSVADTKLTMVYYENVDVQRTARPGGLRQIFLSFAAAKCMRQKAGRGCSQPHLWHRRRRPVWDRFRRSHQPDLASNSRAPRRKGRCLREYK